MELSKTETSQILSYKDENDQIVEIPITRIGDEEMRSLMEVMDSYLKECEEENPETECDE